MTKKVVIDNAVPKEVFKKIQEHMLSLQYNWHYGEGVADKGDVGNFQFIHTIFDNANILLPYDTSFG